MKAVNFLLKVNIGRSSRYIFAVQRIQKDLVGPKWSLVGTKTTPELIKCPDYQGREMDKDLQYQGPETGK